MVLVGAGRKLRLRLVSSVFSGEDESESVRNSGRVARVNRSRGYQYSVSTLVLAVF